MNTMIGMMMMIKAILILFTSLTVGSIYATYSGIGLEEIKQDNPKSSRVSSSRGYSNGSWSYGK